jgi:predicted metal-dependent phosphoesterase TrpH
LEARAEEKQAGELQVWTADLHVHTCLSPCGSLDMTPAKIAARAVAERLAMIAVTDHNSAENAGAVMRAARGTDLVVLPGLEIATSEEAHVLALCERLEDALALQELVYDRLLPGENDEELFGLQVVANEHDEVEGMNRRLLIGATTLGVGPLVAAIHARGGLAVASHIDRNSFSLVGQLGFIPPDLPLDALEISRHLSLDQARARFPEYRRFTFLAASDAHELDDLGRNPATLRAGRPCFAELRRALHAEAGRAVIEEAPGT